jgi:hypothetical protein
VPFSVLTRHTKALDTQKNTLVESSSWHGETHKPTTTSYPSNHGVSNQVLTGVGSLRAFPLDLGSRALAHVLRRTGSAAAEQIVGKIMLAKVVSIIWSWQGLVLAMYSHEERRP